MYFAPDPKYFAISIHAPRVGSDPKKGIRTMFRLIFQSTLPVWGATSKQTKYSYLFCIKFIKIANISKAVVKKILQNFYLRYLKRFFQVRSSWYFCVHLSFALFFQAISGSLNNECSFNVIAAFCAKMLNFCFIFVT